MWNQSLVERMSCALGGIGRPLLVLCRWMTFGGAFVMGMLLNPLSNRACVAILTQLVSGSHHGMSRIVCGTEPRKIPFWELGFNFVGFCPGGGTHARHPSVWRSVKSSCLPVAWVSGDDRSECRVEIAFRIWREGQNA